MGGTTAVVVCRMQSGGEELAVALKRYFGHASFRANQREIIEAVLAGRDVISFRRCCPQG